MASVVTGRKQLMVHRLREAGAAGAAGTDRERHELLWQGVLQDCRKKNIHSWWQNYTV